MPTSYSGFFYMSISADEMSIKETDFHSANQNNSLKVTAAGEPNEETMSYGNRVSVQFLFSPFCLVSLRRRRALHSCHINFLGVKMTEDIKTYPSLTQTNENYFLTTCKNFQRP